MTYLEEQYAYMERHLDIDICGGAMEYFGNCHFIAPVKTNHIDIVSSMIVSSPIFHPTAMFRRSSIMDENAMNKEHEYRLYEKEFLYAEDCRLWIVLAMKGLKFANIPNVLVKYRKSDMQITATRLLEMKKCLRKMRGELWKIIDNKIKGSHDKTLIDFYTQMNIGLQQKIISRNLYLNVLSDIYRYILLNDEYKH